MGLWSRPFGGEQPAAGAGATIPYRVGVNETCRGLAQRFYGDVQLWERIYRDNERSLRDEVHGSGDPLPPGTEVVIRGARYGGAGQPIGGADQPGSAGQGGYSRPPEGRRVPAVASARPGQGKEATQWWRT
jgi:hypothetical protein